MASVLTTWILLAIIVNGIMASVVSSHAKQNGKDGYFWIVFFLGIIGVLLYVADMAGSNNAPQSPGKSTRQTGRVDAPVGVTRNTGATRNDSNAARKDVREELYQESNTLAEEGAEVAASAVYDCLKEVEDATPEYFFERVYPVYPAGYDSKEDWWEEGISPRLQTYPGVLTPEPNQENWMHDSSRDINRYSRDTEEERPADTWMAGPDSDFMHRELGELVRGLHVEITDGETNGKYFVNENGIRAESHTVVANVGKEWDALAQAYLKSYY